MLRVAFFTSAKIKVVGVRGCGLGALLPAHKGPGFYVNLDCIIVTRFVCLVRLPVGAELFLLYLTPSHLTALYLCVLVVADFVLRNLIT